jgi:hypothetical protein
MIEMALEQDDLPKAPTNRPDSSAGSAKRGVAHANRNERLVDNEMVQLGSVVAAGLCAMGLEQARRSWD